MENVQKVESTPAAAVNVDPQEVVKMAKNGARNLEIAGALGITCRQLVQQFRAELWQGRSILKVRLRERQLNVAMDDKKPDVRMLQWLGRQYLDQSEKAHEQSERPVRKLYRGIDFDRV